MWLTHKQDFVLAYIACEVAVEQTFLDETLGIRSKPFPPRGVKCSSCYRVGAERTQLFAWQRCMQVGMGQESGRESFSGE